MIQSTVKPPNSGTMNDLSDEACLDIKNDPLEPKIGHLRDSLQQALGPTRAASSAVKKSSEEDESEQG